MDDLQQEKLALERWAESAEGTAQKQHLDLASAVELQKILKKSPHPGTLLEVVYDLLDCRQRKLSGTFFTPCNVAGIMVKNALECYLSYHTSEEDIFSIKILDPACGAGEFLMAALEILLEKRRQLEPERSEFELIGDIVKNNLYGIDCNGNSVELLLERLNDLSGGQANAEHFAVKDALDFPDAGECFGNDMKFDLVIGNPPYVSFGLRNVGKISALRAAELKNRFAHSAEYKITLYALFMEFALNSTAGNGVNSFIVPDSFLCGQFFGKIRDFLLKNSVFESFMLIRKKIFKAVPGSLVIYTLRKSPPSAVSKFRTVSIDENDDIAFKVDAYSMYQSEFKNNFRQRFRLFFDRATHEFVREFERKNSVKLGMLVTLASGIIGLKGKKSIVSNAPLSGGDFRPGITSGRAVTADGRIVYSGEYINCDPAVVKSGLGKVDYARKKLLIRQTGDRIVSAVDNAGLLVLNNLHVAVPKDPLLDLEKLSAYLNSPEVCRYYQAITLEANRVMAQIDLETLRELPVPPEFEQKKCGILLAVVPEK